MARCGPGTRLLGEQAVHLSGPADPSWSLDLSKRWSSAAGLAHTLGNVPKDVAARVEGRFLREMTTVKPGDSLA